MKINEFEHWLTTDEAKKIIGQYPQIHREVLRKVFYAGINYFKSNLTNKLIKNEI